MHKIKLIQGDITTIAVEAMVNAANSSLLGGGGVDGAIHRAGGPEILDECRKIKNRQGGCKTGDAVITQAGNLPADYVIHAVGPFWSGGNNHECELLRKTYQSCFDLISQYGIKSVSFPNISTGIYKFPKELAAQIALDVIKKSLAEHPEIQQANICCFEPESYQIYLSMVSQ